MRLNSADKLVIEFDDLSDEEDNEFYYKTIHCTKDWEPSPIQDIEFVEGFAEERIRDWQLSLGTKADFHPLLVFHSQQGQSFAYFRQLFVVGIRQGKRQCTVIHPTVHRC